MNWKFLSGDRSWKSRWGWLKWVFLHAFIALMIQQIGRLIWFAGNAYWLQPMGIPYYFKCFLWGFYFDLPVVAYLYLPIWLMWMWLPARISHDFKPYKILFTALSVLTLTLNSIDAGYSIITSKRSGAELFPMLLDPSNPVANYLKDYWFGIVALAIATWLIFRFLPMPQNPKPPLGQTTPANPISESPTAILKDYSPNKIPIPAQFLKTTLRTLLFAAVILFLGRGGARLRPLRAIDAAEFVLPEMGALVVSTPFQMLSSLNAQGLKPHHFLPISQVDSLVLGGSQSFQTLSESLANFHTQQTQLTSLPRNNPNPTPKNIVLIIVESLARDYTGFLNGAPYTPFLDQLAASPHSIVFPYCYANGTKSIEMAPSIFAGMPSLMEDFYITSGFSTNKLTNACGWLKAAGYQTAFYHGSNNGTMGFQSFLKQGGLQHYFGIDQYPKDMYNKDFDGHWGIYDEPYLQFVLQCMDTTPKPMFQAVFTLSSHHPYSIPNQYLNQLPGSNLTVQKTIAYADLSLRHFFQEAAKKSWYNNTIFVITGDHTSHGTLEYFYSPSGHYEIPLLIFDPSATAVDWQSRKPQTQKTIAQTDILPTVFSTITGKNNWRLGMGRSAFDSTYSGYSVHKTDGIYYIIQYPLVLAMDEQGNVKQFYAQYRNSNKKESPNAQQLLKKEALKKALMARVQKYNQVINANQWDDYFGSPKP